MTFDRFGDPNTEGTFAADMDRARGYKPITREDLTKAYAQYNEVGLKFGVVKKTDTDTALYNKAKKYVLDWWKKEKTDAALLNKPPRDASGFTPVRGSTDVGGAFGGSTGGSYYGGVYMPNTAFGTGGPSGTLPSINQIVSRVAATGAMSKMQQTITSPAPAPRLTTAQGSAILKAMGAPATWNPPWRAYESVDTLRAWIKSTAEKSQLIIAANKAPIYNDAYVAQVIKNLGITGITAASVPVAYRQTASTLNNYLLAQQAALKLRAATLAAATAARLTSNIPVYNPPVYVTPTTTTSIATRLTRSGVGL